MASNFLSFLGGAATRGSEIMKEQRSLERNIQQASMQAAIEDYQDSKKKYDEVQKWVNSGQPVPVLAAQAAGFDYSKMSPEQQTWYNNMYGGEEGTSRFLDAYNPGSPPNMDNYKQRNSRGHPLIDYIKEKTGMAPNTAYARANENSLVKSGIKYPEAPPFPTTSPDMFDKYITVGNRIVGITADGKTQELYAAPQQTESMFGKITTPEQYIMQAAHSGRSVPPAIQAMYDQELASKFDKDKKESWVNMYNPDSDSFTITTKGSQEMQDLKDQGYALAGAVSMADYRDIKAKENIPMALSELATFIQRAENLPSAKTEDQQKQFQNIQSIAKSLKKMQQDNPDAYTGVALNIVRQYQTKGSIKDESIRWKNATQDTLKGIVPGEAQSSGSLGGQVWGSLFGNDPYFVAPPTGESQPAVPKQQDIRTTIFSTIPDTMKDLIKSGIYKVKPNLEKKSYDVYNSDGQVVYSGNY